MFRISSDTHKRLRDALLDCGPFDSDAQVRAVFAHPKLRPWKFSLLEASRKADRVDFAIADLSERYSVAGENALVLFLRALSERLHPDDECFHRLIELADELDRASRGDPSTARVVRQEANPTGQPMAFVAVDEQLLKCAQSVCRVSVPRVVGGCMEQIPTGTGWLVTPELALTCWHVIEARSFRDAPIGDADLDRQIVNSLFTFEFTTPGQGVEYGVTKLEYHDPRLDYALLRLGNRPDNPLSYRGFLRLDQDAPLTIQTQLFVIQHPKGQPQQRSAGFYVKPSPTSGRILHNAPTEEGTSGAPVLNVTNWRVIALHNGEHQTERLREATLVKAILVDLEESRPDLYREITAAQDAQE